MITALATAASLLAFAPPIQEIETLLLENDALTPGVTVGTLIDFSINDEGAWMARVSNGANFYDRYIVQDGVVTLQEDELLPPLFGFISFFGRGDIDAFGRIVVGANTGSWLLYSDNQALIWKGDALEGFAWESFDAVDIGGADVLAVSGVASGKDVVARVHVDPGSGAVTSQTVLVAEGDPISEATVLGLSTFRNRFSIDADGREVASLWTTEGGVVLSDGVPIAVDDEPSPLPGFTWDNLSQAVVGRHADGGVAFAGDLLPFGRAIVHDGEVFLKEGDPLEAFLPYVVSSIAEDVRVTQSGEVVWRGSWDTPDLSRDNGIFLGHVPVASEGDVTASGETIETLEESWTSSTLLEMSPSGRFVLFWARLTDGRSGLFRVDLGSSSQIPGCFGNIGTLKHSGGPLLPGRSFELALDAAQTPGALPFLAISDAAVTDSSGCGIDAGFGELLLDLTPAHLALLVPGDPWTGAAVEIPLNVPSTPGLAGLELYAQGAFLDLSTPAPLEPVRATNGLALLFGK